MHRPVSGFLLLLIYPAGGRLVPLASKSSRLHALSQRKSNVTRLLRILVALVYAVSTTGCFRYQLSFEAGEELSKAEKLRDKGNAAAFCAAVSTGKSGPAGSTRPEAAVSTRPSSLLLFSRNKDSHKNPLPVHQCSHQSSQKEQWVRARVMGRKPASPHKGTSIYFDHPALSLCWNCIIS